MKKKRGDMKSKKGVRNKNIGTEESLNDKFKENKSAKKNPEKKKESEDEHKGFLNFHNRFMPKSFHSSENKEVMKKDFDEVKDVEKSLKEHIEKPKGDLLEKYQIEVDGAKAEIEIRKEHLMIVYNLEIPPISLATATLLNEIRNELISVTTVSMKELTDPSMFFKIKERFMRDAQRLFHERLPHLDSKIENFLVGTLMQEMLGLGRIEFLVGDPNLEEIVIPSAKEPIRVYSKKYGWLMTNITIDKEDEIVNYSNIIARRVGRQITILNPLLDAHLVTGDRVNAVLYPINTKGNTITIRKFARDPFTMIDFIKNKTCDINIAALLWLATEFEMNVLISGGTGSGKTSFLNACMPFVPPNQRMISIEDTRELMLPDFLYWTPLVTRTPNPEGKGEVSMLDLLINSLRMRPDRIILGEMRKQQEAMVLFEAMHTGHSVFATVHADSAAETISRLVNPPLNVPPNLLKAVNLNVVMFRDRKKGIRRVMQVAEYEAAAESATSNILYRWIPDADRIVAHSTSSRFFEDISRNTGMSQSQIKTDLQEKTSILDWLVKNNIRSLQEFGMVMNLYYRNKELLLSSIKKNDKSRILEV
ncbi:CpaF family protein [Candidatus Pacearchaeota archaeon]|nr:CpaF family protein [Candidatus Pacearchaeota archaeon]